MPPPFDATVGWLVDARGARTGLVMVGSVLIAVGMLGASRREVREAE